MLHSSKVPEELWAEACHTATYLLNRVGCKNIAGTTPFEAWFGKTPEYSHLRVFGCDAYAHVQKEGQSKFSAKSEKCIFVGYADTQKGYRLWNMKDRRLKICRDVVFNEIQSLIQ